MIKFKSEAEVEQIDLAESRGELVALATISANENENERKTMREKYRRREEKRYNVRRERMISRK